MADKDKGIAATRAEGRKAMYAKLDKAVGKGLGRALKDQEYEPHVRSTTGSIGADYVTGGGVPMGAITEIYGSEGSGKTTLAQCVLANIQRQGHDVALCDAEHQFDPTWAGILGLDVPNLLQLQPDNAEQAFRAVEVWLEGGVKGIVVDSVAALVPQAVLEGDVGDAHVGRQARLMSQGLARLMGMVNRAQASLIFINQLREKVGVMFGSPETTPGGKALKFYAGLRLDCRRTDPIKEGDAHIGTHIKLKCVKNRGAAQYRVRNIPLMYGKGLDLGFELVDIAAEHGIVEKSGAWYSYGDVRVGQGRNAAAAFLNAPEQAALRAEIYARALAALEGV